jgi:hypothetical protein
VSGVYSARADQPLEEVLVEDVPLDRRLTALPIRVPECLEVEGDDTVVVVVLGEVLDQPVADLAVGTGDEDDGFSHGVSSAFRQPSHSYRPASSHSAAGISPAVPPPEPQDPPLTRGAASPRSRSDPLPRVKGSARAGALVAAGVSPAVRARSTLTLWDPRRANDLRAPLTERWHTYPEPQDPPLTRGAAPPPVAQRPIAACQGSARAAAA